jgi:hypothetical protein
MYITSAKNLAVGYGFNACTKKKCNSKADCGFIPNYPPINFNGETLLPTNGWFPIEDAEEFILSQLGEGYH